jgi:periplasmic protein TonB
MFGDSMLETSWAQRSRRSWMTLASFGFQALAMALLIILSVARPVGLPLLRQLSVPVTLGPPPGPPPIAPHPRATVTQSNLADNLLIAPPEIPRHIAMIDETVPPPPLSFRDYGVHSGTENGSRNGVFGLAPDSLTRVLPPPPAPVAHPPRISHMMEGNLLYRAQPEYPALARSARIQGTVLLSAIISKEGTIENLRVLTGHPMLVRAAIDAVSRWRYRPYVLNNEPVEVETQITVNFSLSGN